jgi:hypothetical protein
MRISEIKQMLIEMAEDLMQLADQLGVDGRAFSTAEKELFRTAMTPRIKELTESIRVSYLLGDVEGINDRVIELRQIIEETI